MTASGTSAHQTARQLSVKVSSPPRRGPRRLAAPALAPQIPSAAPRRAGGNPLTAPASAAGLTIPAAAPCETRAAINAPALDVSAPAVALAANRPRPSSARLR